MEQYRTYLRAELGKLSDVADCRDFIRQAGPCLAHAGLPADPVALSQSFANQGFVDLFVGDLEDDALIDLTSCCGRWRDNAIASRLSPSQHPRLRLAATDRVRLNDAEGYLAGDFARLDWELLAIARDETILSADPYRMRRPDAVIAFGICLANPDPDRVDGYRIFDGMHRAIQMVRNNVGSVLLCVVEPPGVAEAGPATSA